MNGSLKVHIIPAGKDDVERMYYPVSLMNAEKVYLIRNHADLETHNDETELLKSNLIKIIGTKKIVEFYCDFYDLDSMMAVFADIFRIESKLENSVFINLAGGTNITVAGVLSAQYFNGFPYFLKRDYVNKKYIQEKSWIVQPRVSHIKKPAHDLILFLIKILDLAEKLNTRTISKTDCVNVMIEIDGLDKISKENSSKYYNRLKSHYLTKLCDFEYLTFDNNLGGMVTIQDEGKSAAKTFGIYYGILSIQNNRGTFLSEK